MAAPAVRAALPATSEPIAPTAVVAIDVAQEKAQQTQLPLRAQSEAQTEERPKTRRELREERRAERREWRHHRKLWQQQEASGNGEISPQ
ncbi:polynucleotide 5'-kinase involved in rRNA processing [Bradyrhizobium sp. LB7.2]